MSAPEQPEWIVRTNGARVHRTAFVFPRCTVRARAIIYGGVFVDPSATIGAEAIINDEVFVSAEASIGPKAYIGAESTIGDKASIGAGVYVGPWASIGAGAAVATSMDVATGVAGGYHWTAWRMPDGTAMLSFGCETHPATHWLEIAHELARRRRRHRSQIDAAQYAVLTAGIAALVIGTVGGPR